jgi:glycosyltransferase involved in cell wall biosynthesis
MNILVISTYFGPETSVGVLRINAFVKYWTRQGHVVHVVTMPYAGESPTALRNNARLTVHQISPMLLRQRASETVQSYSKDVKGIKQAILNAQYWLKRRIFSNYLDPRVLWWPRAAYFICKHLALKTKFDFMVSTVPSYTAHSAAAIVKWLHGNIRWVADYRDLWCGNPIFPGCSVVRMFERCHERAVLKKADLIVSINQALVRELTELHGCHRKYTTIANGYDDDEVPSYPLNIHASKGGSVKIIYAGSILPGLQDPTPLLQAIKELAQEGKIDSGNFSLEFIGNYSALVNYQLANDDVVRNFIRLRGRIPRSEALQAEQSTDFLLFLGSKPVSDRVGSSIGVVSGKIFEYMTSGTEIMAVGVTDEMLLAEMLQKSATGKHYGSDVMRLKQRILEALASGVPKVTPNMNYLDQFRRSVQAEAFLKAVVNLD